MDFSREKNGYNIKEVDNYISNMKQKYEQTTGEQKIRISDLKRELESTKQELSVYKDKNSDISNALVVAVETAKQIENSSKNVYALEIKRLRSLYSRWDSFLSQLIKTYPAVGEKYDYDKLLKEFGDKIDEIIKQNSVDLTDNTPSEPVGIRNLISKMGGLAVKRPENNHTYVIKRKMPVQDIFEETANEQQNIQQDNKIDSLEQMKNSNLESKLKPIANMQSGEKDKFDSLVEKFFDSPSEDDNAYAKALIRKKKSNGFDLKEALNPTEDLAEIMKDFNFFDDDNKDK